MTKKKGMTDDTLTLEALQVPENKRNFMNDQVFKFVFGKKQRKAIAIDFINAVLQNEFGSPVKDLEYEEQELSAEKHGGKESRLDVVCRLDNGALVDIEVQLLDQKNIAQRVLYYWAGEYRNGIHQGGGYRDLRPTIIICILGFPCFEGDEAFSSWGICNLKTFTRLTKDLSLHFLEIPKFSASLKPRDQWTKIERWMCYFSNRLSVSEKKDLLKGDAMISQAIAATDKFFSDPVELRLYREQERARMDAMERDQCSKEEGRAEGIAEGSERMRSDMVAKLLRQFSVDQVASMLSLSPEYVSDVAQRHAHG